MMKISRHTLNLAEKFNKRLCLPHEGSARVLTRPKNVTTLAEEDQFASDAIQFICFSNRGARLGRNRFSAVVA